jgi:hypothetical protein
MYHVWERRVAYKILIGQPEGKRRFGRPMRKWKDNIKRHLQELRLGGGA